MRILATFVTIVLLVAAPAAFAGDYSAGDIKIMTPWTRATPPGAQTGGGFVTLVNEGEEADRLTGVASPVAGRAEIHTMKTVDGVMQMRPVAGGVPLSPGETVELKPGGLHIMLMDLTGPIEQGTPVTVTLTFEKAGAVEVPLTVAPPGAPGPQAGQHKSH